MTLSPRGVVERAKAFMSGMKVIFDATSALGKVQAACDQFGAKTQLQPNTVRGKLGVNPWLRQHQHYQSDVTRACANLTLH